MADSRGRAVAFHLAPGQAHELPSAPALLARLPGVPAWVVADRGYASAAFRSHVWDLGARPAVPAKRNEAAVRCPDFIYVHRNRIERLCGRLKEWRALATRYREDRRLLPRRPLPRGYTGLAQELTGPSHRAAPSCVSSCQRTTQPKVAE